MKIGSIYFLFFILIFSQVSWTSADWQSDLEAEFDIVETFDGLQDWRGINDLFGYDFTQSNMPKKINDSNSIWDFYDYWSYENPTTDFIKNHGVANVWQGTGKSLIMDINQRSDVPKLGPSRFGLYFGSNTEDIADGYSNAGLANSGYRDIYYFYMVKMPNNTFPTLGGGIWPSDDYKWWSYYKFNTMSAGFLGVGNEDSIAGGAGGCRWEYGCSYVLSEMKQCGSACPSEYESTFAPSHDIRIVDYYQPTQIWSQDDVVLKTDQGNNYLNQSASAGEWFGIEYHINAGTPGLSDGSIETWMYEEDGTVHLIHSSNNIMFMQAGTDLNYNRFFFGGNLSYSTDVSSQNLNVAYYVDDFVIDNNRIGPTYFNLLGLNADMTAPASPSGLNII